MFKIYILMLLMTFSYTSFANSQDYEIKKKIYSKMEKMQSLNKQEMVVFKRMVNNELKKNCDKYNFDYDIAVKLLAVESQYDYKAVSRTGARGLMQFTSITLKDYSHDVYDYKETIQHGVKYLNKLYKLWRKDGFDHKNANILAVASYNCGRSYIIRDKNYIEKNETKSYIKKIFGEAELKKFTR